MRCGVELTSLSINWAQHYLHGTSTASALPAKVRKFLQLRRRWRLHLLIWFAHAIVLFLTIGACLGLPSRRPLAGAEPMPQGDQPLHPRLESEPNTLFTPVGRLPPGRYELHWEAVEMGGAVSRGTIPFRVANP
jgi:hypothetical protein